jgi:hypothetical protein
MRDHFEHALFVGNALRCSDSVSVSTGVPGMCGGSRGHTFITRAAGPIGLAKRPIPNLRADALRPETPTPGRGWLLLPSPATSDAALIGRPWRRLFSRR